MKKFNLGDEVLVLRESLKGIVRILNSHTCIIEDEDGFSHEYPYTELAVIHHTDFGEVRNKDIQKIKSEGYKSQKHKGVTTLEIDLHIENLRESTDGLSNHDIVLIQVREFQKFLKEVERQKARKAVIIHGKGTGKLRNEIRVILAGISGCEFYDGDFAQNGIGATIAEFKYNY